MSRHEPVSRRGRGPALPGPGPGVQGPSPARCQPLVAALLTLGAWFLTLRALAPVIAPGPWQAHGLAVLTSTLLVPGLLRVALPRHQLAAVLTGLVAGAAVVLLLTQDPGALSPWVTDPLGALRAAGGTVRTSAPPLAVEPSLEVLALVVLLLLGWACALMSAGGADQVGATVLVPALALLLPPALAARSVPGRTVLLVAVGALLLIATGAPRRRPTSTAVLPRPRRLVRDLRTLGARLLAVTAALPLAALLVPAVPEAVVVSPSQVHGASTSAGTTLTLGADLVHSDGRTVLRYTDETGGPSASGRSLRLTLAVIRDLEGSSWEPLDATDPEVAVDTLQAPSGPGALTAGGALAAAGGDPGAAGAGLERLRVTDVGLASQHLPTLQSTVLVTDAAGTSPDAWRWVSGTTTAVTAGAPLERGQAYTLVGWTRLAGHPAVGEPPRATSPSTEALGPYTVLPADVPEEVVVTAQEVVSAAGATDPAARAAALEAWFHGPGFTYDESAPGSFDGSGDSPMTTVSAFLVTRSGYCVHYAATFTLMARSLGLPTRLSVGYATRSQGPGTPVTGRELHAWPEVWIDGEGWTAYEPTPGGAGARADAAATSPTPSPASTPSASAPGETASQTALAPSPTRAPGAPSGSAGTGAGARALGLLTTVLPGLALLLAPAAAREAVRRRRGGRAAQGPDPARSAWRELLAEAHDLRLLTGSTLLRAQTPEAVAEALGAVTDGAGAGALHRLARAVTREHYAAGQDTGTTLGGVGDDLGAAVTALRGAAPARRRILARLLPTGLVIGPWRRPQDPPSARG